MSADGLLRSRRALVAGVGQSTRENRVLPFAPLSVQIPARVGSGQPERKRAAPIDTARGFVASPHGATTGYRFDPYTLAVQDSNYGLVGAPYAVMNFATAFHVSDATHWDDTICFYQSLIEVNAAEMSLLAMPTAILSAPEIPYLIKGAGAGNEYGTPLLNATEKRVFAVGRYQVQTWGGGGSVQTLQPTSPRSSSKAMTGGQRTDIATNKAWLCQFYYTGIAWDDNSGAWEFSSAEVSMLLAASYLSKVDATPSITMSPAAFGSAVNSSGNSTSATTLPSTPVFLVGTGEVYTYGNATVNGYDNGAKIIWPWSGTVDKALAGDLYTSYSRVAYSGSQANSPAVAGVTLTYSASNSKTFDSGNNKYFLKEQTIAIAPGALNIANETLISGGVGILIWYSGDTPAYIAGSKKGIANWHNDYYSEISGSTANRTWEDQTGNFSVKIGSTDLFSVQFSRHKTAGQVATLSPNTSYYAGYLANPYGNVWDASGMGVQAHVSLYEDSEIWGRPPADVHAKMVEMGDAFAQMTLYTSEAQNGVTSRSYYSASVASGPTTDTQALSWTTKDYLLYDPENGVYITIEGAFTGTQSYGSAASTTLSVILKITTRHHVFTKSLYSVSHAYAELLPETQVIVSGKNAIPSPKILSLFVPLYQEQGSFKGASYVTLSEENAGAAPAHMFNFLLSLRLYSGLSTLNEDNRTGAGVAFVPLNLVEALYAFVFSQEYGVGSTRYPVSSTTRYNDLVSGLFSSPVAIQVKNGAESSWPSGIESSLSATAGLWRT